MTARSSDDVQIKHCVIELNDVNGLNLHGIACHLRSFSGKGEAWERFVRRHF